MKHPKNKSFIETVNMFRRLDYNWHGFVRTVKFRLFGYQILLVKITSVKDRYETP